MDININEVKRDGRYNTDTEEQPEITLEISGRFVVYGDENKEKVAREIEAVINEYAI